jgi:hypothetical protein
MRGANVTLEELKRVLKRPLSKHAISWTCLPQCDCDGGDWLNHCDSTCRIHQVYVKVYYLYIHREIPAHPPPSSKSAFVDQLYGVILEQVNALDMEDVLCPICMDRLPFFSGCPKTCHISVCILCAKQLNKCPTCSCPYPAYRMNAIARTNAKDTIVK